MKRFVIEREIPGIGGSSAAELSDIALVSNSVLSQLGRRIQWEKSYVTGDRLYCVYRAEDEADLRRHAELGGLPADRIAPVVEVIDPFTAA